MRETSIKQPCITLLYSDPNLYFPGELQMVLDFASVEGNLHPENIQVNVSLHETSRLAAEMVILDQKIKILGARLPLPDEVMTRCVHYCHWQGDFKRSMKGHKAQVVLTYSGPGKDPLEKMIMLYKTAYALRHESLLGIVNEPAWTAHPVLDTLEPERIRSYRESIPFLLWFGYLKVPLTPEHALLVSRGHDIFNLPDLAYLLDPGDDSSGILNTFFNVFYYMSGNKGAVKAGDTLEVSGSGEYLRFNEMPDLPMLTEKHIPVENVLFMERSEPGEVQA